MRVGVISDSHWDSQSLRKALAAMGAVDLILHAGDMYEDAEYLSDISLYPVEAVAGNCDSAGKPTEKVVTVAGQKVLLTHGHKYGVKLGLQKIGYLAEEKGVDAVVFGHTHVPCNLMLGNVLLFNPGSISLPRDHEAKTFGILKVCNNIIRGEILKL